MARITVHIPESIMREIDPIRSQLNLSKICQDAILEAVHKRTEINKILSEHGLQI